MDLVSKTPTSIAYFAGIKYLQKLQIIDNTKPDKDGYNNTIFGLGENSVNIDIYQLPYLYPRHDSHVQIWASYADEENVGSEECARRKTHNEKIMNNHLKNDWKNVEDLS